MTTCTRSGCSKKLRKDNSKGVCSSNCESPEAPGSARAKGVKASDVARMPYGTKVEIQGDAGAAEPAAAARFRAVHDAMGMDPEKTLEEFYASWLEGIKQALES